MIETFSGTVEGRQDRSPADWEQRAMDVVQENAADGLIDVLLGPDMPVFLIRSHVIHSVAGALHSVAPGEGFDVLLDITSVDYSAHAGAHPHRFGVVWHFLDPRHGRRVRVSAYVADGASVPSLAQVYRSADWAEREVFDMMGIPFSGHPNLKRILMPQDYEGYPQRKEFPTQGPERGKRIHGEVLGNKPLTSWKELHEI